MKDDRNGTYLIRIESGENEGWNDELEEEKSARFVAAFEATLAIRRSKT